MKKIALVLLILLLSGCSFSAREQDADKRMQILEIGEHHILMVDTMTGVTYLRAREATAFTVVVDRDGNPYIANGWRDFGSEE